MTLCTVEIVIGDDPESLGRIVRVVSIQPFRLEALHFWRSPGSERRRVVLEVHIRTGGAELLAKRLNRIVSVERVRVLDQYDPPVRPHPRSPRRHTSERHS